MNTALMLTVKKELLQHNAVLADRFEFLFTGILQANPNENELVLMNRFWRLELGRLPIPTFEERSCLCDTSDFGPWFANFKRIVIPTIIQYNLPVQP